MAKHTSRAEKIKILFANHPEEDTIFFTSDGRAFFKRNMAESYASALQDKRVTPYTRTVVEKIEEIKERINAKNEGDGDEGTQGLGDEGTEGAGKPETGSKETQEPVATEESKEETKEPAPKEGPKEEIKEPEMKPEATKKAAPKKSSNTKSE